MSETTRESLDPAAANPAAARSPAPSLFARLAAKLPRANWAEVGLLVLAILPAIIVSVPLLGDTPLSYDHATHLFKGWHFWDEMLARGRLRGWSHFWGFGFPSDELVPCGGELWIALFRAVTLGQLSWMRTYSLAFAGFLIFKTAAAYWFARGFRLGRAAAVACAWFTIGDPGGMLEGGWTWHTYWGVWPVSLAMSFALLALVRFNRILEGGGSRDVFAAGAWLGAALLTHQMPLPTFAVALPLLVLDHLLRARKPRLEDVARVGFGLAFAFALVAFFLVPFLARTRYAQDLGSLGDSLPVVAQNTLKLETFQNVPTLMHALPLLGAWFALRRRLPGGVFLTTAAVLFVVLGSGTLLRDLHLERALPTLVKLEANRFLLIAKLFWFPLGGLAAVSLLGLGEGSALFRLSGKKRTLAYGALTAALLGAAVVAPTYAVLHGANMSKQYVGPDAKVSKLYVGEQDRQLWASYPALLAWTRRLRDSTTEHYRIAYEMWRNDHLSTIAPAFDHTLMYKIGSTPTQIFDKMPMTNETELLEALSVKYVVSATRLNWSTLELERRFGRLWVYRFLRYRPEPFTMLGPGHAELLEFSPERVRIRVSGTSPESRLKLHVASYDRWQARTGSEVLPLTTVTTLGIEYPDLMEVPVRDGELVLEYVYRTPDWLGLLLSLGALPAFFALRRWNARSQLLERVCARIARAARPLTFAGIAAVLLATVAVAAATQSRDRLLPPNSLFRLVKEPADLTLDGQPCEATAPLLFSCGARQLSAEAVSGAMWGLHLCMAAPPDANELQLRVQGTLGSVISGYYEPRGAGAGTVRIAVDDQELGAIPTRPAYLRQQKLEVDTRTRRGQAATIAITLTGAALYCFDFSIQP